MLRVFFGLVISFLTIFPVSETLAAPSTSLSMSPASLTALTNQTFNVDIIVDTGGNQIVNADLVLNYNPQVVEVTNISVGSFFQGATEITKQIDNRRWKLEA